ncbi:MAG: efflux RND transporter periplasmic adaptor subunit [Alphaproteobacteria bacterium]|nr:efflux RND transporter periplasmic adaptor subunit [Alphaproteobacteria bacterium]
MKRPWSLLSQTLLLLLLSGIGATAWVSRERIGDVLANLQTPAGGKPEASGKASNGSTGKASNGNRRGAAPVIAAGVSSQRNDAVVAAIGTARALKSVTLFAKSEGEIMSFAISAGDPIEQGQTLVQLDATKAELAVDLAKKTLEDARQKLQRAEYLKSRNVNSGAGVEDATITVERAELEVRQAEEELRDKTLSAPFAGVVGIPKVEAGDRITPATELVTLDDRSQLLVEFPVAEKFLARIKIGDEVSATTPSYPRRTFSGRLAYIDSRVDPVSRTIMVRAIIPNGEDLLRPGMSFSIEMSLPGDTYPAVPELALQWSQGESYVWRIDGNVVRKIVVESVQRMNAIILVKGPLTTGDLIVVEGVQRLRDGIEVTYEHPDGLAAPGSAREKGGGPATGPIPAATDQPVKPRRSARTQTERRG